MLKVVQKNEESNDNRAEAVGGSLLDEIVRDGARQMLAAALWRKYCGGGRGEGLVASTAAHPRHGTALRWCPHRHRPQTPRTPAHIAATLLYATKDDQTADDEIRAWRRRRPTPKPSSTPSTWPPAPAARSRHACPHCGHEPTVREQAVQQRADLAEVWLEPDGFGELTETHHCAACAPHGPITERARRWLTGYGWQIEPELTCPQHSLAQGPNQPH